MTKASSNVLRGQDFYTEVSNAADTLYDHLRSICGPYAEFSVIPQRDVNKFYHVYTKDGIDILKQVKFDNRTLEHVRHLATYIGSRVDAACHDGTTTSMMFFLSLAKNLFYCKNYITSKTRSDADRRNLAKTLETELIRLRDAVDASTVTLDDDMFSDLKKKDVAEYIAYHQALMSSKGNTDLAKAVAKVVGHLPPELYGQYTLNRTAQETAKEFEVIQQTYDISATASFPIASLYNSVMKTQYKNENAYVLSVDPEALNNNNTPETDKMIDFFKRAMVENQSGEEILDRDLILITTNIKEPVLDRINAFNRMYNNKIIPIELMQTNTQMFVHIIEAIRCMSGVPSLGDITVQTIEDARIASVDVTFSNSTIYLSNLYTKTDSTYHPFYDDPEAHPPYTRLINEMRNTIQQFEDSAKPDELLKRAMPVITPLYRQLVCQDIWDLKIGGPLHDHLANYATVQDAFGSATSGVQYGFIIGGLYRILATYTKDMVKIFENDPLDYENMKKDNILQIVQKIILFAMKDVLEDTYRTNLSLVGLYKTLESLQEKDTRYIHLDVDNQDLHISDMPGDLWTSMSHEEYQSFSIEPAEKYKELINRLIEVLPKMIETSAFIDIDNVSESLTHG